MARILKHTLFVRPAKMGSYSSGWGIDLKFVIAGAIPSGSQVICGFKKPDGSEWMTITIDVDEQGEDDMVACRGTALDDDLLLSEAGDFAFDLRLVSELEGVDDTLLTGTLPVLPVDGGSKPDFAPRVDWLLALGTVGVDVRGDSDAPKLEARAWLGGDVDTYQVGAYLFYEGKKIRSSEARGEADVEGWGDQVTTAAGGPLAKCFSVTFPTVRGWMNGGYGDSDSWHLLAANPGSYEIKLTREKKLDRVIRFKIGADGRMESTGPVLRRADGGLDMRCPVEIKGKSDGAFDAAWAEANAFYGNPGEESDLDLAVMYEAFPGLASGEPEGDGLSEEVTELRDKLSSKASNIVSWYADDMEKGGSDSGFLTNCDMVVMYVDEAVKLLDELASKAGDVMVEVGGEASSIDDVRARLLDLAEKAKGWKETAENAANDELAPYRALLANDKLRIFEEHPANGYRYYTSRKKVIETPEELAEAKSWYFEGTDNQGYLNERWTVKGWTFDDDGVIVNEHDESGFGTNAPGSAFP